MDKNSEQDRVIAEDGRVAAEADRVNALNKYVRRAVLGYLILALGMTAGLYKVSDNNDKQLRNEINRNAVTSCISSRSTLQKYNNLVDAHIVGELALSETYISQGKIVISKVHEQNVKRLSKDKLHVPTIKECQKLILRP